MKAIEKVANELGVLVVLPGLKGAPLPRLDPVAVHRFVEEVLVGDVHAKRVLSLANAVTGVMHATSLTIHAIGQGLALASGCDAKHAIKQVDRLLSNAGVDMDVLFRHWVAYVLAERSEVVVAMDWTEFAHDDQTTLAIHLVTTHGRSTPLIWRTYRKSELKGNQTHYEDDLVGQLAEVVPEGVTVTLLADRGFGDQGLYELLDKVGLRYIIRFRQDILVTNAKGETRKARAWLPASGRSTKIANAKVTERRTPVGAVVCAHHRGMAEAWCLATNRSDLSAAKVVSLYGKRFTIEENFRDQKDLRFGLGLSSTRIGLPTRRDRLLFISALAQGLLTLLGAAAEDVGLDRTMKANTATRRTHSLFRQGCFWYAAIPKMKAERLEKLMLAFQRRLSQHAIMADVFGIL